MNNGKNIARTPQMFGVYQKQVRTMLKNKEIIQQEKHSSKASGRGCTAKYPIMEDALYAEYKKSKSKRKFLKKMVVQHKSQAVTKRSLPW